MKVVKQKIVEKQYNDYALNPIIQKYLNQLLTLDRIWSCEKNAYSVICKVYFNKHISGKLKYMKKINSKCIAYKHV